MENLIYADMKQVAEFLAPAGIQFPLAAKKGNLINYSIKTEEDLVKFKLQKEEEKKGQELLPVRRASIAPGV